MSKKHLYSGIVLILLSLGLSIARIVVYGFDFGLMSVWFGDSEMNWARTILDGLSGLMMVEGIYVIWLGAK